MANVLFLVHRIPYPPNKGDKLRSFHLLKGLAAQHKVFLGTLVDDPADMAHVPTLRPMCEDLHAAPLHPVAARMASLQGLLTGRPLTLHYFHDAGLARWVRRTVQRHRIDAIVVFSSSMAQYAQAHPELPMFVDFVDVDSAKWAAYAPRHRWPLSWLYRREAQCLLACERDVAAQARRSFFATEKEAALFRELAPECAQRVEAMNNGVDTAYYSPSPALACPFAPGETPLVFTGAMDYWPNIDAVGWFATEVLPRLRAARPQLRFHIVGRAPTAAVRALAANPQAGVVVTGTVPDVRPYLQHAAVVVAPLRLARGVQNKILEAMAMGRPVVAAASCVEALTAEPGRDILAAGTADDYVHGIEQLLQAPDRAAAMGSAGRQRVTRDYAWEAHLAVLSRHLAALRPGAPGLAVQPIFNQEPAA